MQAMENTSENKVPSRLKKEVAPALKQSFMGYSRLQEKTPAPQTGISRLNKNTAINEKTSRLKSEANEKATASRLKINEEKIERAGTSTLWAQNEKLGRGKNQPEREGFWQTNNKKKLWWQIGGLGGGIVALGALFLTVIFPWLVHFTGVKNSAKYVPDTKQIKPQAPTFNAPPANTNVESLKISGFAPAENQVQFVIDDEALPEYLLTAGANGEFALTLKLLPGENTLQAYVISKDNLESEMTKKYTINYDAEVPEIDVSEPENNQEIVGKDKKTLMVRGMSEAGATIVVNNQQTTVNDEGNFELSYLLNEGDNTLKISAHDKAGNQSDEIELKVKFTP